MYGVFSLPLLSNRYSQIKTKMAKTIKKSPSKKVARKKAVVKKSTSVKSSDNKELEKMLKTIKTATKNGDKSVVVFTTNRSHHKANVSTTGWGVSDLKPKYLDAYKKLLRLYNVDTKLVNFGEMSVEWIVKIKK